MYGLCWHLCNMDICVDDYFYIEMAFL